VNNEFIYSSTKLPDIFRRYNSDFCFKEASLLLQEAELLKSPDNCRDASKLFPLSLVFFQSYGFQTLTGSRAVEEN
jgi:hypothetical protein